MQRESKNKEKKSEKKRKIAQNRIVFEIWNRKCRFSIFLTL